MSIMGKMEKNRWFLLGGGSAHGFWYVGFQLAVMAARH